MVKIGLSCKRSAFVVIVRRTGPRVRVLKREYDFAAISYPTVDVSVSSFLDWKKNRKTYLADATFLRLFFSSEEKKKRHIQERDFFFLPAWRKKRKTSGPATSVETKNVSMCFFFPTVKKES